jgi:hypothetical protein
MKRHILSLDLFRYFCAFSYFCFSFDTITGLQEYLEQTRKYVRVITKAAEYREDHYVRFIKPGEAAGIRFEDEGHRYWREGMNRLAADAHQTFQRWNRLFLYQIYYQG